MGMCCCTDSLERTQKSSFSRMSAEIRSKLDSVNFTEPTGLVESQSRAELLKSFKVIKPIGRGLFSKVYLAVDQTDRKVALKVISKSDFSNKDNIKKIIVEKEVLKLLESEHVLKLYRTIQTNSKVVFVLEYAGKGNLLQLMNVKTQLTADDIRVIAAQLIEALLHIHSKGVIYGDLKAENVLINNNGIVKLCDFNFSGTSSLLNDTLQGTVNYLAPEIVSGLPRTPKSDFWALGVLLHLLFYKRFPFKSSYQAELFFSIVNRPIDPEPVERQAPTALRLLITDLMCKSYKKRIGNSLLDFQRHRFFSKFNWNNYKTSGQLSQLIKGVPSFENDVSQSFNESSVEEFEAFKGLMSHPNTFHYDIKGFTYVNEALPEEDETNNDFGRDNTYTNSYHSPEANSERGSGRLMVSPSKGTKRETGN